jgi:hypothetical protein
MQIKAMLSPKMRKFFVFGILCFLSSVGNYQAQTKQNDRHCKVADQRKIKFKLLYEAYQESNTIVSLNVVIRPRNMTAVYLTSFARYIKLRYCNQTHVYVDIFDNEQGSGNYAKLEYFQSGRVLGSYRGQYILLRDRKSERLLFSNRRGGPIDENDIRLAYDQPTE